jgi:acyl-coenzyme A thioesterase PaaI-like protein
MSAWLDLVWADAVDEAGVVRATFHPKVDRHEGAPGFLHGGAAAAVLDEVMGAVGHVLDEDQSATATLSLRYRRPVPMGQPLTVEAWREGTDGGSRRRHRVHGRVLLADGSVAVEAHGIFVSAPATLRGGRTA